MTLSLTASLQKTLIFFGVYKLKQTLIFMQKIFNLKFIKISLIMPSFSYGRLYLDFFKACFFPKKYLKTILINKQFLKQFCVFKVPLAIQHDLLPSSRHQV